MAKAMVSVLPIGVGAGSGTSAPLASLTVHVNAPAHAIGVGGIPETTCAVKVTGPVVPLASTQSPDRLAEILMSGQPTTVGQVGTTRLSGRMVVVVMPPGEVSWTVTEG